MPIKLTWENYLDHIQDCGRLPDIERRCIILTWKDKIYDTTTPMSLGVQPDANGLSTTRADELPTTRADGRQERANGLR